jgi:HSP20 family protein
VACAQVPGLTRDDVKVAVSDDNVLTISGERRLSVEEEPPAEQQQQPPKGEADKGKAGAVAEKEKAGPVAAGGKAPYHHRIERSFGRFVRSFALPRHADAEKVKATVTSGVLTVRVPKKEVPPEQASRGHVPVEWKDL